MSDVINSSSTDKNTKEKKRFRIPSMSNYWENFWVSILLHLLLPLFPLAIEKFQNGVIDKNTLVLAASMYIISIGVSSRSRLMFSLTIVASMFYLYLYGAVSGKAPAPFAELTSTIGIIATFIIHAGERYNRHVVDRSPFWEFMSN